MAHNGQNNLLLGFTSKAAASRFLTAYDRVYGGICGFNRTHDAGAFLFTGNTAWLNEMIGFLESKKREAKDEERERTVRQRR